MFLKIRELTVDRHLIEKRFAVHCRSLFRTSLVHEAPESVATRYVTIRAVRPLEADSMISTRHSRRNMINRWLVFGVLLLLPVLFAGRMSAQSDNAQIQGTVPDASGGVISGAKVMVTNVGTGATFTATSDAGGNFAFNALQRGQFNA